MTSPEDVFDGLGVLDEALFPGTDPHHGPNAKTKIERVGVRAKHFADVFLEQAMDRDHIPAAVERLPSRDARTGRTSRRHRSLARLLTSERARHRPVRPKRRLKPTAAGGILFS